MVAYWRYVWENFGWNPVELQAVSLDWNDPELIQFYQNIKDKYSEPQFEGNIYWVYCSLRWMAYKRWMEANKIDVIVVSDTDMIGYGLTPKIVNNTPNITSGFYTPQWGFHIVTLEYVNDFILKLQNKDIQQDSSNMQSGRGPIGILSDMHIGQRFYPMTRNSPLNRYLFHYSNNFLMTHSMETRIAYETQDANKLLAFLIKHARLIQDEIIQYYVPYDFSVHNQTLFKDSQLPRKIA